jgi:molybdopterin-containing oxidoreductase family iron-sulfur binding subunit
MSSDGASPDLEAIRTRLAGTRGRVYWRSLEELADSPAFRAALARQFPSQTAAWVDPLRRRDFLRLMAASLAFGGLTGCTSAPPETIVPYARRPEDFVPGKPLFFATAMPGAGGLGLGLLVESHLGRPTKVEGNPSHPASLGATDACAQASVLTLYDPDRAQTVTYAGDIRPWSEFLAALRAALGAQRARGGAGLRILTETVTSPTLSAQLAAILTAFPQARWHQYEVGGRDMARAGARLAFGEDVDTQYGLANAAVVVALDADFLGCGPAHLPMVRAWAGRRRPGDGFSRLYAVESTLTPTGAKADHRLALRAADVESFARALAARLGVPGVAARLDAAPADFLAAVARDLGQQRGRSVVIPGDQQPPVVHALAHAMNEALVNVGRTVVHTGPVEARPEDQTASLRALVADMDAGTVELLVILGGNPVYTAPADVPFAAALDRVPLRVRLGLYHDETTERCHWHVPEAHYLEAWSDVRAFDGTVSIVQPLIAPLYGGHSAHEVLAAFGERPERAPYDLVRERWGSARRGADFEADWRRWLHDGVVPFTAARAKAVRVRGTFPPPSAPAPGLEIVFRPDPALHDGRFANNGWLQELPRPLTHVTWDNPVLVGPTTAERLGLATEDIVELRRAGRSVTAPVWILPGHPEGSVTVHLGHGRRRAGRVGTNVGFDAGVLRTADAPAFAPGAEMVRTGRRHAIPTTQQHHRMEGRDIVRAATLADLVPPHAEHAEHEASLYPSWPYEGHRWAMAIDLSTCVGCTACVVACQAENNIPVVGREQVLRGRDMHWLRVDTYHSGDPVAPETHFMPVPCMHCENAPCELVCPTEATVHSAEGLNDMVYNRCVGTRYCSNNCPYKVRRFNYFQYADWSTESLKALRNPDVTVRSRGVMEKCTYCVQRLTQGRITAEKEGRRLRDGEVVTACAQACPADAIVFGDLNDPASRVAKLRADARHYALLEELNTKPRTTYLAAIRNPDPELG